MPDALASLLGAAALLAPVALAGIAFYRAMAPSTGPDPFATPYGDAPHLPKDRP